MVNYRAFKASEQRELAQQIAAELNDGVTRERHAEVAAAVLTSDWLIAHDAEVARQTVCAAADELDGVSVLWFARKHIPRPALVTWLRRYVRPDSIGAQRG